VVLVEMTDSEREDFVRCDVADYAAYLADSGSAADQIDWEPRLRDEHATAVVNGDRQWTALATDGASVGWLWVMPAQADMPSDSAFLYQILVRPESRRKGFGRAMLAALEDTLARDGIVEVRLNVFDTNHPARTLYADAGYELVRALQGKSQLRKRLADGP
jgi:ribosomal protein S18 acetylase RimI-like enzyme